MAKKDLRAQMDAARAAAAYIGAAHDDLEEATAERPAPKMREGITQKGVREAEGSVESSGTAARTSRIAAEEEDFAAAASAGGGPEKPKAARQRKSRKKSEAVAPIEEAVEGASARMTAQVLVPMTAEQREHADLLASVMKITRAEVMRQALDEYWESHKAELQAAVAAYEELIKKLMK